MSVAQLWPIIIEPGEEMWNEARPPESEVYSCWPQYTMWNAKGVKKDDCRKTGRNKAKKLIAK